jgi:hypothetical protein
VIDDAITLSVILLRRHCGLRLSPIWDLEDARQSAAMHYLATGNVRQSARLVWNDFRRDRYRHKRFNPGLPDDLIGETRCNDPIPDKYFHKCSDRERAALCLCYESDMTGQEIAESLNCSWKAAKLLLVRGRAKARKAITA